MSKLSTFTVCTTIVCVFLTAGCSNSPTKIPLLTTTPTPVELRATASTEFSSPTAISTLNPALLVTNTPEMTFSGTIAIAGNHQTNTGIRLFSLDSGTTRDVSSMGFSSISWSPDSQWLAFNGGDPRTQRSDIFLIRPDGSDLKRITNSPQGETDLDWSPDGKFILYTYDNHSEPSNLALANIETSGLLLLTTSKGYEHHPVWSPDGKQIAYLYFEDRLPSELWVMDIGTKNARRVIDTPIAYSQIAWSPDGDSIAFISPDRSNNCGQINIVKPDGSSRTTLTNLAGCATNVVWSPDGKYLAFAGRIRSTMKGWQIYVMDQSGHNIVPVTDEEELPINDIDWSAASMPN